MRAEWYTHLDTKGLIHIGTHRDCDSRPRDHTHSSYTKSQHGEEEVHIKSHHPTSNREANFSCYLLAKGKRSVFSDKMSLGFSSLLQGRATGQWELTNLFRGLVLFHFLYSLSYGCWWFCLFWLLFYIFCWKREQPRDIVKLATKGGGGNLEGVGRGKEYNQNASYRGKTFRYQGADKWKEVTYV